MRSITLLGSFALLAIALAGSSASASPDLSKSIGVVFNDGLGHTMPYRLFLPPGYDTPGAQFPLVLFMHGVGECGSDNVSQVNSHIDGLVATTQTTHPAFLLAPQVPNGRQWVNVPWSAGSYTAMPAQSLSMQITMKILQDVIADFNVDTHRLYATGLSMGGFGAWDVISRYPSTFAAAVPMSGGGCVNSAPTIANIPVWAFHGSADGAVPVSGSRDMINALNAAGGHPLYTELAGQGHVIWAPIYNDPANTLYPWLFSQSTPEPATLSLLALATLPLLGRRRTRPSQT